MANHWRPPARGFTLVELIIAVVGLGSTVLSVYILYLIIQALRKYIGS